MNSRTVKVAKLLLEGPKTVRDLAHSLNLPINRTYRLLGSLMSEKGVVEMEGVFTLSQEMRTELEQGEA